MCVNAKHNVNLHILLAGRNNQAELSLRKKLKTLVSSTVLAA